MGRRLRTVGCFVISAGIAGCALRASHVPAIQSDPAEFAGWVCPRIEQELDLVQRHATRVAYAFDERAGSNIVAVGVGLAIFWPALLTMRSNEADAKLLAALKGRHEALSQAALAKSCTSSATRELQATQTLPVRIGDHLIYEQRRTSRAPLEVFALRVAAIRRDELELDPLPQRSASDAAPLQHWLIDRSGNLELASRPPVWPQLLRTELTLGRVISGEMRDPDDARERARVRGQVVAVGPQEIAGRRFDVAIIDLFGDAGTDDRSTRLDGVLVVDRHSGVLLRLDLFSSHPVFQLQRRLARIEHLP